MPKSNHGGHKSSKTELELSIKFWFNQLIHHWAFFFYSIDDHFLLSTFQFQIIEIELCKYQI